MPVHVGARCLIFSKENNMPVPKALSDPDDLEGLERKAGQYKDLQDQTVAMRPRSPVLNAPTTTNTGVDKIHPKQVFGTVGNEKRIPEKELNEMMKPLGASASVSSYKDGTDFVPKTGLAVLHKGEKVTPAKDNMKNIFGKITEGDAKPPKKIKSIHTRKATDGSYIHEHHHHHADHHKMEEHTSPDKDAMLKHLADHEPDMTAEAPPTPAGPQGADQAMAGATGAAPAAGPATPPMQ